MTSASSKALPFISIASAVVLAVLSAVVYGNQIDKVMGLLQVILPLTAGGGLINKYLEVIREKQQKLVADGNIQKVVDTVKADVKAAG